MFALGLMREEEPFTLNAYGLGACFTACVVTYAVFCSTGAARFLEAFSTICCGALVFCLIKVWNFNSNSLSFKLIYVERRSM